MIALSKVVLTYKYSQFVVMKSVERSQFHGKHVISLMVKHVALPMHLAFQRFIVAKTA